MKLIHYKTHIYELYRDEQNRVQGLYITYNVNGYISYNEYYKNHLLDGESLSYRLNLKPSYETNPL